MGKTKEMSTDFRRNEREYSGIEIKGETAERVKIYKYLGITFDVCVLGGGGGDSVYRLIFVHVIHSPASHHILCKALRVS